MCDLTGKVIILGSVINPYPIIKNAHLSVMVSSSESFSLVVVESMALGVPVIATDCGGPREIMVKNRKQKIELPFEAEGGFLIQKPEEWNEDSLVAEIESIVKNSTLREKFVKSSILHAERFSITNSEIAYELLINNLLKE